MTCHPKTVLGDGRLPRQRSPLIARSRLPKLASTRIHQSPRVRVVTCRCTRTQRNFMGVLVGNRWFRKTFAARTASRGKRSTEIDSTLGIRPAAPIGGTIVGPAITYLAPTGACHDHDTPHDNRWRCALRDSGNRLRGTVHTRAWHGTVSSAYFSH